MNAHGWLVQAVFDLRSAIVLFKAGMWSSACIHAEQAVERLGNGLLVHMHVTPANTHNVDKINDQIEREGFHEFSDEDRHVARALVRTFLVVLHCDDETDAPPCELYSKADALQHIQWAMDYFDMLVMEAEDLVRDAAPGAPAALRKQFSLARGEE